MVTSTLKNIRGIFKPFSPYTHGYFFCSLCKTWWPKEKIVFDRNGRPLCPVCRKPLRTKPRKKHEKQRVKLQPFFKPVCPICDGPLSQKFGSERLVCSRCGREFKLLEVRRNEG
ncbi:MAG: hypothetical protein J7K23_01995 [Thermoproteales archaeon]|nr:hypothetical protein [Thermoproteales archaeon]